MLLGLLLLLPPVVRSLRTGPLLPGRYGIESLGLAAAVAATAVVAAASMFARPHEVDGVFDPARMAAVPGPADGTQADPGEWPAYGRTAAGLRYSPLDQITRNNLDRLDVAWTYHAGNVHPDLPGAALEATPLVVGDTMYLCTPKSEVIALDPVTGAEKWRFNPQLTDLPTEIATYTTCRGLSYHDATGLGWPVSGVARPDAVAVRALIAASVARGTVRAAGVPQTLSRGRRNQVIRTPKPRSRSATGRRLSVRTACAASSCRRGMPG